MNQRNIIVSQHQRS